MCGCLWPAWLFVCSLPFGGVGLCVYVCLRVCVCVHMWFAALRLPPLRASAPDQILRPHTPLRAAARTISNDGWQSPFPGQRGGTPSPPLDSSLGRPVCRLGSRAFSPALLPACTPVRVPARCRGRRSDACPLQAGGGSPRAGQPASCWLSLSLASPHAGFLSPGRIRAPELGAALYTFDPLLTSSQGGVGGEEVSLRPDCLRAH